MAIDLMGDGTKLTYLIFLNPKTLPYHSTAASQSGTEIAM